VTAIAFHFNAPDPIAYACRLLRKAVGSGAKVIVVAAEDTLDALDAALWTFTSTDFVPHCVINSEAHLLAMSPVVLATSATTSPHHHVLLNLGQHIPTGFELFERVIEVVALDDESRKLARGRWRQYQAFGYDITRQDLNLNHP
jgi:DNA polymerase-3 subunit chi